jgi:hypothetical protein
METAVRSAQWDATATSIAAGSVAGRQIVAYQRRKPSTPIAAARV